MFPRITLLLLFPLLALSQTLHDSRQSSEYTCIYRLSNEETLHALEKSLDETALHAIIDSFPTDSIYRKALPPGNYVFVRADGSQLDCRIQLVNEMYVQLMENEGAELAIIVHDSSGNILPDATVSIDRRNVPFDAEKQLYRIKKANEKGLLTVARGNELAVFHLERKWRNGRFVRVWKKITYSAPLKYVVYPFRKIYYFIKRGFRIAPRYRNQEHRGYIAFNKPKYLPGDTVKMKAFLLNKREKPVRKAVPVVIQQQYPRKEILTDTLLPVNRGAYTLEFLLGDSLTLNKNYDVQLKKKKQRNYLTGAFYLEDYQLDKTSYTLHPEREEFTGNEAIEFSASGSDANGFPVMDGRLELGITTHIIHDFYPSSVFIPDTIWNIELMLEPLGETKITVPDSLLPEAKLQLRIKARFNNSSNETHDTLFTIAVDRAIRYLLLDAGDSVITGSLVEYGKVKPAMGKLICYLPDGAISERTIALPFSEPLNPLAESYKLEHNGLWKKVDIEDGDILQIQSMRTKDSVFLSFSSPKQFETHYSIYCNRKEIERGFAKSLSWKKEDKSDKSYFIVCNYVSGCRPKRQFSQAHVYDKNLSIAIEQPDKVSPGQQADVKIKVTDFDGEPVKGVNLLASAVTAEFGSPDFPRVPYLGKHKKGTPFYNRFTLRELEPYELIYQQSLDAKWRKKFSLDTLLYYQMLFPEGGIKLHYEAIPANHTEFAPHVFDNGRSVHVNLIYIGNRLVYYAGADGAFPYSFITAPGVQKLTLRTPKATYVIDSVIMKAGYKLDLTLDINLLPAGVKSWEEKPFLSEEEKQTLKKNLFFIYNNYPQSFYVWQGKTIRYFDKNNPSTNRYRMLSVGPFRQAELKVGVRDNFTQEFQFESGYSYIVSRDKIIMKEYHPFTGKKYLWPKYNEARLGEIALSEDDILLQSPAQPLSPFTKYIPSSTTPENGTYHFKADSTLYSIVLSMPGDTSNIWIIPGSNRWLRDLAPGHYHIRFITESGYYFKRDSVKIYPGGVVCEQFDNPDWRRITSSDVWLRRYLFLLENLESVDPQSAGMEVRSSFINMSYNFGNSELCGTVTDENGETIPFASVAIERSGIMIAGAATDFDGAYCIKGLAQGVYDVKVNYLGYLTYTQSVSLRNNITQLDIRLSESETQLMEVAIVASRAPLVLNESVSSSIISYSYDMKATRDVNSIVNLKGARASSGEYIIDGIRASGSEVSPSNPAYQYKSKGRVMFSPRFGGISDEDIQAKSLREKFSDYAYWQPNLTTDAFGEASFKAVFPDNITRWQTYAIGIDGKKHSGIGYSSVRSYKKVAAQLDVPRFMVAGDTAFIIGKALNYTNVAYPVSSGFVLGEKEFEKIVDTVVTSLVKSFPLVAENTDSVSATYLLEIEGGYKDGEKYTVPVYPAGLELAEGAFFLLSGDTSIVINFKDTGTVTLHIEDNPLDMLTKHLDDIKFYQYDCNEQLASKLLAYLMERNVRMTLGEKFTEDNVVNKLIRKLQDNRKDDGTWGWWKNSSFNPWMTAYVLRALYKAEQAGYKIMQLKSCIDNMKWHTEQMTGNDLLNTLSVFSEMKVEMNYEKMLSALKNDSLSLYQKALVVKIRQENNLAYDLSELLAAKKETYMGGIYWGNYDYSWYGNSIQLTLLAYNILKNDSAGSIYLPGIRRYLIETRENGRWRNTTETTAVLETILPDILSKGNIQPSIIELNGQRINEFPFTKMIDARSPISITKTGTSEVYATAYRKYFNASPNSETEDFIVSASFISGNNSTPAALQAGEPVTMRVVVHAKKTGNYIMIEAPIPAGCSYGSVASGNNYHESHREYFKNKVAIFCERLPQGEHVFAVQLEPRFSGSYTLNPTKAELMYFPTFSGNNGMKKVQIR